MGYRRLRELSQEKNVIILDLLVALLAPVVDLLASLIELSVRLVALLIVDSKPSSESSSFTLRIVARLLAWILLIAILAVSVRIGFFLWNVLG
jgi:hypothetical protein